MYGAGVQAKKQVLAVYWALDQKLERCTVHDINLAAAESFKVELEKELGIRVDVAEPGDTIPKGADIIVTASTSSPAEGREGPMRGR